MKVKDLERTANIAWSPATVNPIYLAAGTAAQQLDASFSTNATLEVFSLNLSEPGMEMESKANLASEHRFHRLAWGPHGGVDGHGTIVGGCDEGIVQIYDAGKLLKGDQQALVGRQNKHTGTVHSLDFNPFQGNLLASGAQESEIYIWDLNNTTTPMTPGSKSQPLEDILSIQWNRQVQHILASTFSSKCVVWDLRKNEPIIKLSDTVSRIRWKVVAWHPEVATQLCLASEEDQAPVIQLWDLRFATSPLKTLENHQRGVLSIAWCKQDPDLLTSCGKDNRIVCWNPNSNQPGGEVLSEVARTNQWNFDVAWCPKNPALIATPGYDGHVSVYSLMGGKVQQIQTTNKIADSFPGMEGYVQAPVQQSVAPVSVDLSKPPKWLKKPVGASFGFGGKLFTFEHDRSAIAQAAQNAQPGQPSPHVPRFVHVSQVITEPELVDKSTELERALEYGDFSEYCRNKADSTSDQHKKYIWYFLKANFEQNPRAELLNLLGYRIEDVNAKLAPFVSAPPQPEVDGLTDQFANINRIDDFDNLLQDHSFGDGPSAKDAKKTAAPYKIKTGDDTEGLIAQALLLNNVEAAVGLCLKAKRFADAIVIAMTGGSDLFARTQAKYLEQCDGYISSIISALVSEDWASVIERCDIGSWKEALSAALTHASDEDLPALCELMGARLERESRNDEKILQDAQLCYICAGSFERLVASWSSKAKNSIDDLQELVELVTFLQKSVERQGRLVEVSGNLADLLSKYAFILASQGNLSAALGYLGSSQNDRIASLRERLFVALGHKPAYGPAAGAIRSRQNTSRSSVSSYTNQAPAPFKQFNAGVPPQPAPAQPWQTNNVYSQQPVAAMPPPPPKTYSPAPPVAGMPPPVVQPPRPGSVGSSHGSGLLKNKYVVDPSVQSNNYGARNHFEPMQTQPQPHNFQPNALAAVPQPPNVYTPALAYTQQPAPFAAPQPAPFAPGPAPFVPSNPVAPLVPTNQMAPPPMMPAPQDSAMNVLPPNAAPGWNDPPAFARSAKMPATKRDVKPPSPITHPIFGTAAPAPSNGYVDPNQPYNPYGAPPQNPGPPQMFQPPPPASSTGGYAPVYGQPAESAPVFNTHAVSAANHNAAAPPPSQQAPPKPEQIVQKQPIPEEHIHMQTVFDELRKRCSGAASNPQTKRKIDDVGRKLEMLYDLLREQKLSPNTLMQLHQMVQMVQNGDYAGGLGMHTQMVSGSAFAQIASFMPGLKVLLQCAMQLQVYLR